MFSVLSKDCFMEIENFQSKDFFVFPQSSSQFSSRHSTTITFTRCVLVPFCEWRKTIFFVEFNWRIFLRCPSGNKKNCAVSVGAKSDNRRGSKGKCKQEHKKLNIHQDEMNLCFVYDFWASLEVSIQKLFFFIVFVFLCDLKLCNGILWEFIRWKRKLKKRKFCAKKISKAFGGVGDTKVTTTFADPEINME